MPNSTLARFTEKHSRLIQKQSLENLEMDVEIREALRSQSATSFVTSRLVYFASERGLNLNREVL